MTEKAKELRNIKRAERWVGLISMMKEFQYDDERYCDKEEFHRLLEKFYEHIDETRLLWALDSYREEVKKWKD